MPRNAAIKLNFVGRISATAEFFDANPSAIQLLEFKGDPNVVDPVDAFRILPYRVVVGSDSIVLDTTILGGEANGGITSAGLPLSSDNLTANIRIAIPTRGEVVSSFYVERDAVAELNDMDSAGRSSVIRDFRSGNLLDGTAGRLREPEPPQIVGNLSMGITGIDAGNNTITLNKRFNIVPVRGRYPFVEGPIDPSTRIPGGPLAVPTQRPLRNGDILTQEVTVELSDGSFEVVNLRAEVLENLRIVTAPGPDLGSVINPPGGDSGQGETITEVAVRVATVSPARDSEGRLVSFQANSTPLGEDCVLRAVYVEQVPFLAGGGVLSDRIWRSQFVRIDPEPAPGAGVAPDASIAIEFTKPMDLDQIDNTENFLVTNTPVDGGESFAEQMTDPKVATTRVVPTRLTDVAGDGTVLRLQAPMGFAHQSGVAEDYSVHVRLGEAGITDLAGNSLLIYEDVGSPQDSWSVDFTMDSAAPSNLVGWHTWRFAAEDEDGTLPGSPDLFGQFRLSNGQLIGASSIRFGRSANNQVLQAISRINRGECWDPAADATVPPVPGPPAGVVPVDPASGAPHPGLLYWDPQMSGTINPPAVPLSYSSTSKPWPSRSVASSSR